jgi:hypothetical protein
MARIGDDIMKVETYDPHAGLTLEEVCGRMAELAPCEAMVNGVHLIALPGESAVSILARLRAGLERISAEEKAHLKSLMHRVAYERGTCAGEITRALVMLKAGDLVTVESLLVAEIKRLTGQS